MERRMKIHKTITEAFPARLRHARSIASWWWAGIGGLLALFQTVDWAMERWASSACKAQWEAHTAHLPFGWQAWLIGILVIYVLVIIDGSYRRACKLRAAGECERSALVDIHRREIERLISAECPQLVFQMWGQIPEDHPVAISIAPTAQGQFLQRGFYLSNDGAVAHEITVETTEIGDHLWARSSTVNRIEKGGQGFALLWLENQKGVGSSLPDAGKWDLLEAMAKADREKYVTPMFSPDYSVPISVIYRDSNNVWYRSRSVMTYIRSQGRIHFGPTQHEKCGGTRPSQLQPSELSSGG